MNTRRPGPIYDNALRLLAAEELVEVCRWLGLDAESRSVRLSEALPGRTQHVDLLVDLSPGQAAQLAHVEFVRQPQPDLTRRMLGYRARIMERYPDAVVRQHVVVLGEGSIEPELSQPGLAFAFEVTYLRDQDPDVLLSSPALAPLASLGRLDDVQRPAALSAALRMISAQAASERSRNLAQTALVMAAIRLDADTIESVSKEATMPVSLEGTVAGDMIAQRAHDRGLSAGLAEGLAKGQAQGRVEGRVQALRAALTEILTHRFGDQDSELIDKIANDLTNSDPEGATRTVLAARSLDELV